jgi:hypothetical protein
MADNQDAAVTASHTTNVHEKLTEEYKGKKYRRPDGKVIVVSHILEIRRPAGPFFEAFFNVVEPDPGTTGQGKCSLDALLYMCEAADNRPDSVSTPHSSGT